MAVDRLTDDDPVEISGSIREKQHEHARRPADGKAAEKEVAENALLGPSTTRALMATPGPTLDQQPRTPCAESASADTSPRSALG